MRYKIGDRVYFDECNSRQRGFGTIYTISSGGLPYQTLYHLKELNLLTSGGLSAYDYYYFSIYECDIIRRAV